MNSDPVNLTDADPGYMQIGPQAQRVKFAVTGALGTATGIQIAEKTNGGRWAVHEVNTLVTQPAIHSVGTGFFRFDFTGTPDGASDVWIEFGGLA